MRMAVCWVAIFWSSARGAAQPPYLPTEVRGAVGSFIKVPADTKGAMVRWLSLDDGLQLFPVDLLKDTKTAVVISQREGRYLLMAWTAIDGVPTEPAFCVVVISQIPPGPTPKPIPPKPPIPPPETDLQRSLGAAWAFETASDRVKHKAVLTELYRQAVGVARDLQLKTVGDLFTVLRNASAKVLPSDGIMKVRVAASLELQRVLPKNTGAVLDFATRERAAAVFAEIAGVLERLQ